MTVYCQQWLTLRQQGTLNPSPQDTFDSDFLDPITTLQEQQHRIIVSGDFNETFATSNLLQQLHQQGLHDSISHQHSHLPQFRTYNRGTQVLDYVLVSADILPLITVSAYKPFQLHTQSDHRGTIIDFHKHLLIGNPQSIQSTIHRGLISTNPQQTEKYIQYL